MKQTFKEYINEAKDAAKEFEKLTGLTVDKSPLSKGRPEKVYFLSDKSSIIIYDNRTRIDYFDANMDFITSYTSPKQAAKALEQSGLINEGKKTYGKLILIKQMNMDGDEVVVLEFQDYSEDSSLDAEVELNNLEIKKIGNLAYNFSDIHGQLDYPLDVTKEQEKVIKNILKEKK